MSGHKIFINRRRSQKRRLDPDPCESLPMDIYHRKRRKSADRRASDRTLEEDYVAFSGQSLDLIIKH